MSNIITSRDICNHGLDIWMNNVHFDWNIWMMNDMVVISPGMATSYFIAPESIDLNSYEIRGDIDYILLTRKNDTYTQEEYNLVRAQGKFLPYSIEVSKEKFKLCFESEYGSYFISHTFIKHYDQNTLELSRYDQKSANHIYNVYSKDDSIYKTFSDLFVCIQSCHKQIVKSNLLR